MTELLWVFKSWRQQITVSNIAFCLLTSINTSKTDGRFLCVTLQEADYISIKVLRQKKLGCQKIKSQIIKYHDDLIRQRFLPATHNASGLVPHMRIIACSCSKSL